jgi:inhibitor of KinA sporulation pathway (predicted exonuclease)
VTPEIRVRLKTAIVFDLEFTAWEGSMASRWLRPGEYTEVIQIGAAKVDAQSLEVLDSLNVLVRPRINSEISPYLEKLTGLSNAMLAEDGVDFVEAYRRFLAFGGGSPVFAFGRDDVILESNFRLYGLHDFSLPRYVNIIPWMAQQGIDPRGMHACDVGPRAGIPFVGHEHDAHDDARSVANGVAALIRKGARNLFLDEM